MRIFLCKTCDGRGYSPPYIPEKDDDPRDSEVRPWGRADCEICKGSGYCTRPDTGGSG